MLTDRQGKLSGLFTDSDLARLFEQRREADLDGPIRDVMTAHPVTARLGSMMTDAVDLMAARKISELPVIDAEGRPAGLIDVTDVVGLLPKEGAAGGPTQVTPPAGSPPSPPVACRVFREPEEDAAT